MPHVSRGIPARPHLDIPKREARLLLKECRERIPAALDRLRQHPKYEYADSATLSGINLRLSDAQLVVAREYGLPSWAELKRRFEANPHMRALEVAIRADDREGVTALLREHPALLHLPVLSGNWGPPMSHAANLARLEIMKIAAQLGARDFQHALGRALLHGHLEISRWLMSQGATLERGEVMGPCECLKLSGLRFLAEQGAPFTDATGNRLAPLALVLETYARNPPEKHQILELFSRQGYELPDTPIMALHRGQIERLRAHMHRDRQLIERRFTAREIYPPELGCAADGRSGLHGTPLDGTTLLHLAIEFDEEAIFEWLLEQGADPNARASIDAEGFGGHTPLFNSVVSMPAAHRRQQDARMTRALLRHGASREVRVTLRKFLDWQEAPCWHEARNVTALEWGRGFPERNWVNSTALQILGEVAE
jgi:hypothetical protein